MPRAAARVVASEKSPQQPAAESARIAIILKGLEKLYPDAHCELDFKTPYQLLIATILSAQCTDKRVNLVTPALFARFPTPEKMAKAKQSDIESLIKSTGFFRNKAKNILGASKLLVSKHGGVVPADMDSLLELPGVARKTANVVLGSGFGINAGMVVDTHIGRLSRRLGFTVEEDPVKVERDLCEKLPQKKWTKIGHQLIFHGRRVCDARKPKCGACTLAPHCPSAGTFDVAD
jgi:endonuclease-3